MFATSEIKKQNRGLASSSKKPAPQNRADGKGQSGYLAGPSHFLQRYLGNSYMQSMAASDFSFTPMWDGPLQEKGMLLTAPRQPIVQAKLKIGQPNDKYEQEADQVAEQIMRMPNPTGYNSTSKVRGPDVSRCVGQRAAKGIALQPEEDEVPAEDEIDVAELLSMKSMPGVSHEMSAGLATQIESLQGGQPLDQNTRSFFEQRFGYDFSHVRVHTDARAAKTAQELKARAYTIGRDVVFAGGEYRPEALEGRKLLAHELTHVVQQGDQVCTVMRACNCSAIGARNPTSSEESSLSTAFPRLVSGDWCVSAPATPTYNCIAWSIGNTSNWIWDEVDSVYGDNDGTVSLSDFDSFYLMAGLTPVINATPTDPKVVLYSKGCTPTHAAPKSPHPCGFAFESKLGRSVRIVHDAYQLEGGPVYGNINRYYV